MTSWMPNKSENLPGWNFWELLSEDALMEVYLDGSKWCMSVTSIFSQSIMLVKTSWRFLRSTRMISEWRCVYSWLLILRWLIFILIYIGSFEVEQTRLLLHSLAPKQRGQWYKMRHWISHRNTITVTGWLHEIMELPQWSTRTTTERV